MQDSLTRRNVLTIGTAAAAANLSTAQTPVGERNPGRATRIGVVGGGFGSSFQWHLHPKAKVTAVCDIRPDRLQRLSEVYKCGNTYKNFQRDVEASGTRCCGDLHARTAARVDGYRSA